MTSLTSSAFTPIDCRPSATGRTIVRPRFFAIASSNPVSTTNVPCGPRITQTKYASGCRMSCGSPNRKFSGDWRSWCAYRTAKISWMSSLMGRPLWRPSHRSANSEPDAVANLRRQVRDVAAMRRPCGEPLVRERTASTRARHVVAHAKHHVFDVDCDTARGVRLAPVERPFPDVPVHVEKPPRVRLQRADRTRALPIGVLVEPRELR